MLLHACQFVLLLLFSCGSSYNARALTRDTQTSQLPNRAALSQASSECNNETICPWRVGLICNDPNVFSKGSNLSCACPLGFLLDGSKGCFRPEAVSMHTCVCMCVSCLWYVGCLCDKEAKIKCLASPGCQIIPVNSKQSISCQSSRHRPAVSSRAYVCMHI